MSYHSALDTKELWKQHMGPKAGQAENFLWNLARISYAKCDICGTGAQGMETHIVGANHYKKMGSKFNWQFPPLAEAEDLSKPWVERFETPRGPYFFNHVTGRHGLLHEAGESPMPQENSSAPAYQPPTAPASAPCPQLSAAPIPSPAVPGSTCPLSGFSTAYENALMSRDKGDWRKYMEPIATVAADALFKARGGWGYSCPVCQQENTRGLADHVPSDKHWKKLGEQINWRPPPPAEAHAMDKTKPWVQAIETRSGDFLFNHLTGHHCLEEQTACPETEAPALAVPQQAMSPAQATPPASRGLNHAHWLWVNTVRLAAEQVDELISHRDFEGNPTCNVCGQEPLSKQHLLSLEHFNALQQKVAFIGGDVAKDAMEGRNSDLEDQSKPWVQRLELRGAPYFFNHVTGKELWPEKVMIR